MSSDRTTVLLVEDDQNIVNLVRSNLIAGRPTTWWSRRTAATRSAMLEASEPDAILLDLMLPGIDGFELCRELRERSSVGIIVLSARRARPQGAALNLGADDYMTKPFGIEELLARINATLQRSRPAPLELPTPAVMTAGTSRSTSVPGRSQGETSSTSPPPSSPCCASSSRTPASS